MKQRTSMGSLVVCFFACFLIGIVLANRLGADYFEEYGSLTKYYLLSYENREYQQAALFWDICRCRTELFLFLVLLGCLIRKAFVYDLYAGWFGFTFGYFFVLTIGAFGVLGIFFAVASVCPQVICYLIVFFGIRSRLLSKLTMSRGQYVLECILLLLFFALGILLEVTVNPWLLGHLIRLLS